MFCICQLAVIQGWQFPSLVQAFGFVSHFGSILFGGRDSGWVMALDGHIADVLRKHCKVSAGGTLAWRGRCFAALSEFVDVIGCEDRSSALERCLAISNAPTSSHVIPPLREIFEDFCSPDATVPCWQAITDAVTTTAPHRPTDSSLLASIRARRGIPGPSGPPAVAVMMHPRDRAARGLALPSASADVADADAAEPAAEPETLMTAAELLRQHNILKSRLKTARDAADEHKRKVRKLEAQLTKEIKAREHADAEVAHLDLHNNHNVSGYSPARGSA